MPHLTRAFRLIAVAGICAALAAQPAASADLWGPEYGGGSLKDAPPPPVYVFSWTGLYVGGHAGLMTGNTEGYPNFGCADEACLVTEALFSTDYDMNGGLFGGQIGYNYQFGRGAVVGIEATYSGSTVEGDGPTALGALVSKRELDWLATLTGRSGYAFGRSLIYVKGGVAWGKLDTDIRVGGISVASGDDTHFGWTAGVGFEHAITDRITARIEYAHIDFNSENHRLRFDEAAAVRSEVEAEFDTVTLGVNFKF